MGYVYHGSKIRGLKEIKRRSSTHQKEWVYAAISKSVAAIFISNGGDDLNYNLSGDGTEESPIVLVERKEGMFDKIFDLSGSIYYLEDGNFESGKTGWNAEVVSELNEKVLFEEHIDNVLTKLEELSSNGDIKMYRYPNRPSYIPLDNSDLIPKIINWKKRGFNIDRFLAIYPELENLFYEELNK